MRNVSPMPIKNSNTINILANIVVDRYPKIPKLYTYKMKLSSENNFINADEIKITPKSSRINEATNRCIFIFISFFKYTIYIIVKKRNFSEFSKKSLKVM